MRFLIVVRVSSVGLGVFRKLVLLDGDIIRFLLEDCPCPSGWGAPQAVVLVLTKLAFVSCFRFSALVRFSI